jgi:type II secretory pathway predicted ATPase ExeA
MKRWFNTAGPCKPDKHYMLPPLTRLPNVKQLVHQESYFVIHAPRQTGKTTAMITLAQDLTASGDYAAVMVSAEVGSPFPDEPDIAENAILATWRRAAEFYLPEPLHPPPWPETAPGQRIGDALEAWAKASSRPLVVFIDEIDSLQNQTLITVLRQLRDGYPRRPQNFPQSVGLVGLRDVRDYKVASGGSDRLNTASPFNIKVESLTIGNFSLKDVQALYRQHTEDTGQVFTEGAVQQAFHLTQGQPWLVNALARQIVEFILPDSLEPITPDHVNQAKEILIERQDTHLDSLTERLREARVQRIIEPLLAGQSLQDLPSDDLKFVLDLGLCRLENGTSLRMANPIYQEIIPRVLSFVTRASLPLMQPEWLMANGTLNPKKLLESFLDFWRQHGEPLLRSVSYPEIAPHLVLMAFLHRVVNGGGTLEREYAIGSDRMDLCLRYGAVTMGIELKVWREGRPDPLPKGLEQIDRYLAGLGLPEGWLVIFDRRPNLPPLAERTTTEEAVTAGGRSIIVIRG